MNDHELAEKLYIDAFDGREVDTNLVRELIGRIEPADVAQYHTLLWVVGRAGLINFRDLVENALQSKQPPIVEAAINTIFGQWPVSEMEQYQSDLFKFAKGVEWDSEGRVRLKALSRMGSYLKQRENREFIKYLVEVGRDSTEAELIRESAYRALALGLGRQHHELRGGPGEVPVQEDGWELFEEAENRLS